MKLTETQRKDFWMLAQCWAGSRLDTPKRAALLLEHVEGLITDAVQWATLELTKNHPKRINEVTTASPAQGDAGQWRAPPEGILHHALREQQERDQAGAARAAAEALAAIDDQIARRNHRRMEAEQRTGPDRRRVFDGFKSVPRSEDMAQVASVMQPQRKEFAG